MSLESISPLVYTTGPKAKNSSTYASLYLCVDKYIKKLVAP